MRATFLGQPVRQSGPGKAMGVISGAPSGGDPATVAQVAPLSGARILLAEDNPVNQAVAVAMLEGLGVTVDVANNGNEALAKLAVADYDAVLMDCQMPGLDGFAATAAIRQREARQGRARMPVIALTANAMGGDRERCLAAGMDEYLTKPFKREDIRGMLERWRHKALAPSAAAAAAPPAAALDEAALDQIRNLDGGPELLGKLVDLYLANTPPLLDAMRDSLGSGDWKRIVEAAHSLKSSSASLGATRLASLCREIEAEARGGSLSDAGARVAAVSAEFESVRAALRNCVMAAAV